MLKIHRSLLCLCVLMFAKIFAQTNLGPGRRKWKTDLPENHGLSSENLKLASNNLVKHTRGRDCFVVAKDGVIVHEDYFGGATADTKFESDSAGKSVSAALLGVAEQHQLYDLDHPLASYGVQPQANWSKGNTSFWPYITARHLLTQTTGVGIVPPGKYFTYDSDEYIQHLSYLLTKVSPNNSAFQFANKHFAQPMGFPQLYKYDDIEPEVSIGGGQFMSCRDMARVGQLILNKGKWLDHEDKPYTMVSEEYVKAWTTSNYPDIYSTYGFLTWLNAEPTKAKCCAPRWGGKQCRGNFIEYTSLIGDDVEWPYIVNAPYDISLMIGWLGKYVLTIPSRNITVVTFGESWGSSHLCDAKYGGYDDGYGLTSVWKAIGNLTIPSSSIEETVTPLIKRRGQSEPQHDFKLKSFPIQHKPRRRSRVAVDSDTHTKPVIGSPVSGSCYCYCPPEQGFGQCYNVVGNSRKEAADQCAAKYADGARICPDINVVRELTSDHSECNSMKISDLLNCKTTKEGKIDRLQETSEGCPCKVTRFEDCYFYDEVCDSDDPYTPTNGTSH